MGLWSSKKGKSLFEPSPVLNEFATEYTPVPVLYADINTVIILLCMLAYTLETAGFVLFDGY